MAVGCPGKSRQSPTVMRAIVCDEELTGEMIDHPDLIAIQTGLITDQSVHPD